MKYLPDLDRMIAELITDSTSLTKQNLAERSYFDREHKPIPGCILSWDWSAEKIDALIRALTFGDYENPIGLPKIAIGSHLVIATKTEVLNNLSQSLPGTIVDIDSDRLTIATSSYDLLLLAVRTGDGELFSITELVTKFQLKVGDRFTQIEPDLAQKIARLETGLVKHEYFWVERLAKLNPIPIPFANLAKVAVGKSQREEREIPTGIADFLTHHLEMSSSNFLLVAIVSLLSRISGQNSFDIGFRCAELADRAGELPDLFAQTVPCRIDIDSDLSFTKNFALVKQQVAEISRRQTYSRDIVLRYPELKALSAIASQERLPVEIALVADLEDYRFGTTAGITFVIAESADRWCCEYDPDRIDRQSVTAIIEQLNVFIDSTIGDPDRSISSFSLMSDRDLDRMLVAWNDTHQEYPTDKCIHQIFEKRVEQQPDAIAVAFAGAQLTYRQLNEQANRLAHYLQSLGVQPDVMVGIGVERSLDMLVGILGILKAGGAYVPLDPAYPQERLAFMVEDTAISVLLTQSNLSDLFPPNLARVVCLDLDLPACDELSAHNLTTAVKPDNLAYVIYTSGTTGIPKGVLIEHRSLVNYAIAAASEYEVTPLDRILQFTSLNFDISVEEIFTCITAGATLVLRTEETIEIGTFLQHCREWQITIVSLPTAYWHELTIRLEQDPLGLPPDLRLVVIGGERVATARFQAWQQVVGSRVRLINTYGPTEATVITLWSDLTTTDPLSDIPIGRPLPNVRVYILDPDLQPVPIGVPGELYITGAGLARGYHNRPERNAVRFIPNPFSLEPGERLYETGDLARYRSDGNIDFLGRIDRQVKIRGFRIELGEIEAVLDRHPDIAQTVVMARDDNPGDKRLVAYCVANRESSPKISDLRNFISEQVPSYLVPAMFVMLAELPLSPNGKVDLRALPAPEYIRQDLVENFVAPQSEIERQLTEIWQQALGIKSIGIKDNFFELGGNSLIAVSLFNEIEKKFGKSVSLSTLFSAQTIEDLAVFFSPQDNRESSDTWQSLVQIKTGDPDRPALFCIHALWGNVLFYRDFSEYLDTQRRIYGLQSSGLDGEQAICETIPEMAANYIKEMQTVQPDGPYFLLGFSLGGLIAFEIALQLQAQGHQIQMLTLIDPTTPRLKDRDSNEPPDDASLLGKIAFHYQALQTLNFENKLGYITEKIYYNFTIGKLNTIYKLYLRHVKKSMNELRQVDVVWANDLSCKTYFVQQQYQGKILLFKAEDLGFGIEERSESKWELLATEGLEVVLTPGSHLNMMEEPHIRTLAANFNSFLNQHRGE